MATYRIFCYNPTGATISGTEQVGSIAAATGDVSIDPTKQWWNGPDEDVRYIVAYSSLNSERSNGPERVLATNYPCNLGFIGSSAKTDESFLNLAKTISGSSSLASASDAKTWLNTNGYWTSWSIPPFTGLLDTYSGAAAAYSAARRLSSTYTGSLIRVRRSSDNAEQDIGYNGSNVLDEAALTTFVGADNGFVTTWYDQSGNVRNTSQTTAANQPQIVSSGSVIKELGNPAIKFDGSNDFLNGGDILDINSADWSFALVGKMATGSNQCFFAKALAGGVPDRYYVGTLNGSTLDFGFLNSTFGSIGNKSLYFGYVIASSNRSYAYKNGSYVSDANVSPLPGNSTFDFEFGAYNDGTGAASTLAPLNGNIQEAIFYNASNSTNRTGIESNINTHYSIYPTDSDAAAFVSAAGITDATQMSAINTLVTDLKGYGIWTKMKALYPFVGGSATAHSYNLKNTAQYQLSFSGGWTHSSTGALPNGTNAYADTSFIPNALAQNSAHIGYYSRTASALTTAALMGVNESGRMYLSRFGSTSTYVGINSVGGPEPTSTSWQGFILGSRVDSSNARLFRNGSFVYNAAEASIIPDTLRPIYLGAWNRFGAGAFSNAQCALASIGDGLTDTEAANFYTAVQAFQTTLGRQV